MIGVKQVPEQCRRNRLLADSLVASELFRRRRVRGEPEGFMGVRARWSVGLPLVPPAWRL